MSEPIGPPLKRSPRKNRSAYRSVSRQEHTKLTPREQVMMTLMQQEGLTSVQALALRLKIVPRVARRMKQKLREKGCLNAAGVPIGPPGGGPPDQSGPIGTDTPTTKGRRIRLHAVQFQVKVLNSQRLKPRVIPDFMGCRVVVHDRTVDIYGRKGVAFYGIDEDDAQAACLEFMELLGRRLEHDLKCLLVKPRAQNWCMVKAEWATESSELAGWHIRREAPLQVQDREGKVWLWGDWSTAEPEHEARLKTDSALVNRRLNDWREHDPPTDTELHRWIGISMRLQETTAFQVHELSMGLRTVVELLKPPNLREESEPVGEAFYVG